MEIFRYGKDFMTVGKALQLAQGHIRGVIDEAAIERINISSGYVNEILKGSAAIYGVNTGFGPLCTVAIASEDVRKLQEKLLISHSVGVGGHCERELVKLMIVTKIQSLCAGYSGVRLETIERMLWMLETDIIPVVPLQGSVGASGDLAPLSHCFLPLIGKGKVWYKGKVCDSIEVLKMFNKNPVQLEAKEGLALINGTQFITSYAVLCVHNMHHILAQADFIAAVMVEALSASAMPFSPELHRVRYYKGNQHVAARMYALIHGSEINKSHEDCDRVQDPYSLRCIPQVHGTSRDIWLHLRERTEIELNSVTDNPLVFSGDKIISGGNFHGQPLALTLDYAGLASSEIGSISERRIYLSLEGKTHGVPKLLIENTGINSGFMIPQYTAAALVSENKSLCFPASADSIPTSLGQEDHVSMGSISGRKSLRIIRNTQKVLGIELLCAMQALDFKRPLKTHPVLEVMSQAFREEVPHIEEDVLMSEFIEKSISWIEEGKLVQLYNDNINTYSHLKTEYDELFEIY